MNDPVLLVIFFAAVVVVWALLILLIVIFFHGAKHGPGNITRVHPTDLEHAAHRDYAIR